jgi:hypothetical protein
LILRHPCGYVASVVRGEAAHKFEGRTRSHEDFGLFAKMIETEQARRYGLTVDALKTMHPLERLAWRWAIYYEKAIDDTAELENCRHVLYENICKQPYDESRALFDFTGLQWNEQTTSFIRQSTTSNDPAYYSIFKDPLESAYRWKSELTKQDIERIVAIVRNTKPGRLYAEVARG